MEEFAEKIHDIQKRIRIINSALLHDNVYNCLSQLCMVLYFFIEKKGEDGWSSYIKNEGMPLLNSSEQANLEKMFKRAPWLLSFLTGGKSEQSQQSQESQEYEQSQGYEQSQELLSTEDTYYSKMFKVFLEKLNEINTLWNDIPYIKKMYTPFPSPDSKTRETHTTLFISTLLDSFHVSTKQTSEENPPRTFLILIEEIIEGQWKNVIFTTASLLTPSSITLNTIGKYIIVSWLSFANEPMKTKIKKDIVKGSHSLLISFLEYSMSVMPEKYRKSTKLLLQHL